MSFRFSIIIPVYNAERTIRKCLKSILTQSYNNFELIIINDGSTDSSKKICEEFVRNDKRIVLINTDNYGVSHARNIGLNKSEGDYVIFVDSDDYVKQSMLEEINEKLLEDNIDIMILGITFIDDKGNEEIQHSIKKGRYNSNTFWKSFYKEQIRTGIYGYISNKVYKNELLKLNNILFDENMKSQEDYNFALSAYSYANEFLLCDKSFYFYVKSEASRDRDLLAYLKNNLKLKNILQKHNCYSVEEANIFNHYVQYNLYSYVYNNQGLLFYDFKTNIEKIYHITDILSTLKSIKCETKEIKFVIYCIEKNYIRGLYIYWKLRNKIKKIIRLKKEK